MIGFRIHQTSHKLAKLAKFAVDLKNCLMSTTKELQDVFDRSILCPRMLRILLFVSILCPPPLLQALLLHSFFPRSTWIYGWKSVSQHEGRIAELETRLKAQEYEIEERLKAQEQEMEERLKAKSKRWRHASRNKRKGVLRKRTT